MELSDFVGQPCTSHLAYEFFPKKQQKLDLKKIANQLRKKGFLVDFETPIFIGLQIEKTKVSFFQDGKIMVKDTKQKEAATKIAQKIVSALN